MNTATVRISQRSQSARLRPALFFPVRLVRFFLRAVVLAPLFWRIEWLRWLLRHMGPAHPCVDEVLLEILMVQGLRTQLRANAPGAFVAVARYFGRLAWGWC